MKLLIIFGPMIVVLIFAAIMMVKMWREDKQGKRYAAHLQELSDKVKDESLPSKDRHDAMMELMMCTPTNFRNRGM